MIDLSPSPLVALTSALYEAAAYPETWPAALANLSKAVGAAGGHFVVWDKETQRCAFARTSRSPRETEVSYAERFSRIDPCRQLLDHRSVGKWLTTSGDVSLETFQRSEYYQDFFSKSGFEHVAKCRVADTPEADGYAVFGLVRGPRQEPFAKREVAEIGAKLNEHLGRAAMLHSKLAPARVRGRLAEAALDQIALGILVTRADGKLLAANARGLAVVEAGSGLTLQRGRVKAVEENSEASLRALITNRRAGWLRLLGGGREPLVVTVAPLPTTHADAMLLLVHDTGQPCPKEVGAALQNLYRLTAAEARLACLVGTGTSPAMAAAKLQIAEGTARSELKHIFEKLGVRRQGELVSLVTQLLPLTSGRPAKSTGAG